MRALILKHYAAVLAALFIAGCATKPALPPTPKEELSVWLSESPRAIAIKVDQELPSATIQTHDSQSGRRMARGAGGGAVGAVATIGAGCLAGLAVFPPLMPIGCTVGLIAAPIGFAVGATAGAVSVKSTDENHPIDAAQDAAPLFDMSGLGIDLAALLSEAIIAQNGKIGGHVLRAVHADEEGKALPDEEALLQMRFSAVGLAGDVGQDPRVALRVGAYANLQTPAATANGWAGFLYVGSARPLSEWKANDARLFRDEIAIALRAIATQLGQELRASPSGSVVSKVAAAKARESSAPRVRIVVPTATPVADVRTEPPVPGEDFVNCTVGGERKWTYRSRCD